jgi:hypothetical protein
MVINIKTHSLNIAMGEGPSEPGNNPLGVLCVGCKSEAFYYGNCLFDLVLSGIYLVPATYLLLFIINTYRLLFYIHVKNFCLNKTTYERLSKNS